MHLHGREYKSFRNPTFDTSFERSRNANDVKTSGFFIILKSGFSSEQLKLREYQDLKDMIKSQGKMAQIIHSKIEDFENELDSLSEDTFVSKMKCSVS